MAGRKAGLNDRRARFVEEYLTDLNATQAAIRAGFSAKTARAAASRLLANVDVAAAIEKGKKKSIAKTGITRTRTLAELEQLAFSRIDNYQIDVAGNVTVKPGIPESAMGAIKSMKRKEWSDGSGEGHTVEVELTFWDKPGMLKLAGRYRSIRGFADRIEHTGKGGKDLIPPVKRMTTEEMRRELAGLLGTKPTDDAPGHDPDEDTDPDD